MPEERDSLIDGYEARIRELEAEKAELLKQFEPFITAEFARTLCELREGDMEREIAGDFRKVVKAVMDTGQKGKVTAVFTIAWKKDRQLRIDLDCKPTIPKFGVDSATAYADEDGTLHRKDPADPQMTMNFERKEHNA